MMWLLWLGGFMSASAGEICEDAVRSAKETRSVVWVSPLARRGVGWLSVTDAALLRKWVEAEQPSAARFLQHVGVRRGARDPKRPYKVVVFDVSSDALCVPGQADPTVLCDVRGASRVRRGERPCGEVVVRGSDAAGATMLRGRWEDLAVSGFCVLPLERFLAGS